MVQRMLDYTREGIDPDINLIIEYHPDYGSFDEPAQITTNKVRMQLVDNTLYASIYDIVTVQDQIMESYVGMQWHPVWQQLFVNMAWQAHYRAGTDRYGYFSVYSELDTIGETFRTPTRMLDGKIMIPIYDFTITYPEHHKKWDGYWNEETNTMTLHVYNPTGYGGPS